VSNFQCVVNDRAIRELRQRDALLDGDLLGGVFRCGICDPTVVGRLPLEVYGLLWKASLRSKTDLYYR